MSMMSNRSLLAKADLALSDLTTDGGLLEPEQAEKFIRLLIKKSALMQEVQTLAMSSPKRLLETLRFSGRVLVPGAEATALPVGQRSKPGLTKRELDAKLLKAEVRLNNEVLEDSIERATLKNTIMQSLAEAVARDLEFALINGDTLSADPLLAVQDGVRKLVTQTFDHTANPTNTDLWTGMIRKMPSEFLDRSKLKFYTSIRSGIDWRDSLIPRDTPLGDQQVTDNALRGFQGIPIKEIPEWDETASVVQPVLTDPKNIVVGFVRKMRIETDRDVTAGEIIIVVTMRVAFQLVHPGAAVKGINVNLL
jgi:HK97 family phage major capsid protein